MVYSKMNNKCRVINYIKQDGSRPVEEYIDKLSFSEQTKTIAFIAFLEEQGPLLPRPYADFLEDGIHELRMKLKGEQVRILYFFCYQNIIVLTNVFEKHTDVVPRSEINLAKERRKDFLRRYKEKEIRELL